jgi:hypothetical protein
MMRVPLAADISALKMPYSSARVLYPMAIPHITSNSRVKTNILSLNQFAAVGIFLLS